MTDVLISGGGIAGLTLGILLKEAGFEPLVIEREPASPRRRLHDGLLRLGLGRRRTHGPRA